MKMRFSGHLGLSAPDRPLLAHLGRSVDPLDQIDALADHGFVGVQDLFLKLRPEAEQAVMAARLRERGLVLSSFGGDPLHWNTPLWTSPGDAAGRAAVDESVAQSCALARRFGGAGAVCVAGLDPDRGREAQLAALVENLARSADAAERAGLVLLVEAVSPYRIPGLLLDTLEDAVSVVRAVDRPTVRLMFDVGHTEMMAHDVPSALADCADVTGLIQIADVLDPRDRVDPGLGRLDWSAILRTIVDSGYTGPVELEFEPVDPTPAGEAAMLDRLGQIVEAAFGA